MDVDRLKLIAEKLFPEQKNWRKAIGDYLGVNQSTVFRWIARNRVPTAVYIALEHSFRHGVIKRQEVVRV